MVLSLLLTHSLHKHIFIVRQTGFQFISRASANISIIRSSTPFSKLFHRAEISSAKAFQDLIQEFPLRLAVKGLVSLLDGISLKLLREHPKELLGKNGIIIPIPLQFMN